MIIIGHPLLEHAQFVKVEDIEAISHTQNTQVVFFDTHSNLTNTQPKHTKDKGLKKSLLLAQHCNKYGVTYAVIIQNLEEFLLHASLNPAYIIVPKFSQAQKYQKIAERYLFDSKLLCVIRNPKQIAKIAENGIDGVIFKQVLGHL